MGMTSLLSVWLFLMTPTPAMHPSLTEWYAHVGCVAHPTWSGCELCRLPVRTTSVAFGPVVAVGRDEDALRELRHFVEVGTRVATTASTCRDSDRARFVAECAPPVAWPLMSLTTFHSLRAADTVVPLYVPERIVFLIEDPRSAVKSPDAARNWTKAVLEVLSAAPRPAIVVDTRTLMVDPENTIAHVIDFMRGTRGSAALPPSPAARTCISRDVAVRPSTWVSKPQTAAAYASVDSATCAELSAALAHAFVAETWPEVSEACASLTFSSSPSPSSATNSSSSST